MYPLRSFKVSWAMCLSSWYSFPIDLLSRLPIREQLYAILTLLTPLFGALNISYLFILSCWSLFIHQCTTYLRFQWRFPNDNTSPIGMKHSFSLSQAFHVFPSFFHSRDYSFSFSWSLYLFSAYWRQKISTLPTALLQCKCEFTYISSCFVPRIPG